MLEEYNEETENVALFPSATVRTGLGGTAGGANCFGVLEAKANFDELRGFI